MRVARKIALALHHQVSSWLCRRHCAMENRQSFQADNVTVTRTIATGEELPEAQARFAHDECKPAAGCVAGCPACGYPRRTRATRRWRQPRRRAFYR